MRQEPTTQRMWPFLTKFGVPYCVIQTVLKKVHFILAIRSKKHFISFNFYSKMSSANVIHDYPAEVGKQYFITEPCLFLHINNQSRDHNLSFQIL